MATFTWSDPCDAITNWDVWYGGIYANGTLYCSWAAGQPTLAVWNKTGDNVALGPDYYVQAKLWRSATTNSTTSLMARATKNGDGTFNFVQCSIRRGSGTAGADQIQFWAFLDSPGFGSGYAQVGTSVDVSWTDGDTLKFEVAGLTLKAYRNGTLAHTATLTGAQATRLGSVAGTIGLRWATSDGTGAAGPRFDDMYATGDSPAAAAGASSYVAAVGGSTGSYIA